MHPCASSFDQICLGVDIKKDQQRFNHRIVVPETSMGSKQPSGWRLRFLWLQTTSVLPNFGTKVVWLPVQLIHARLAILK